MKKAIISNYIDDFVESNNLSTVEEILQRLPEMYEFLRNHPDSGDVLPKNMEYQDFLFQAERGLKIAKQNNIFNKIKRTFFN